VRTTLAVPALIACLILAAPAGHAQAPADGVEAWSSLVGRSPCVWMGRSSMVPIVGAQVTAQPRTTQAETACAWRTGNGNPVLTVAVVAWASATALVLERDAMLQQIAQYGGDRFERLPSPGGVATLVIRNDRGRITVFPTGSGQTQAITINPHFVLKETAEQKAARRERALSYARELMRQYRL